MKKIAVLIPCYNESKTIKKVIEDFKKDPPITIEEAKERIKTLTGIERGCTQIATFLKKKDIRSKCQELYQQRQIQKNKESS